MGQTGTGGMPWENRSILRVERGSHKPGNAWSHQRLEEEREILPLEGTGAYQQLDLRLQASRSVGEP